MRTEVDCKVLSGWWWLYLAVAFPVGSQGFLAPHMPQMEERVIAAAPYPESESPRRACAASPEAEKGR